MLKSSWSALLVPESKRVGPLMQELREQQLRMAVPIDEYGGIAGIVIIEDPVEEIVGELEEDLLGQRPEAEAIAAQTLIAEAHLRSDEANAERSLRIPEGEYETLAGYILDRLGRLPKPNDSLHADSALLTVLSIEAPRMERVQISRPS